MEALMKKLMLGLTVIAAAASFSANACDFGAQPEAQYIGKVKNFAQVQKSESLVECTYQIEFTRFDSSMVCPLDIDEVYSETFQDYSCSLKNGDQVSGYMARINDRIVLE